MDPKLKKDVFQYYQAKEESQVDLSKWQGDKKRRFERHEFFDTSLAHLVTNSNKTFTLKDIGYGGCAVALEKGSQPDDVDAGAKEFEASIRILDQEMLFKLSRRHGKFSVVGFEILNRTEQQLRFLQNYIRYIEASLTVQQANPKDACPEFVGPGWLNLICSGGAIRFDLYCDPKQMNAHLVFKLEGRYYFSSWKNGVVEIGILADGADEKQDGPGKEVIAKALCILVGLRRAASFPSFTPVIRTLLEFYKTM